MLTLPPDKSTCYVSFQALIDTSGEEEDRECLEQTLSVLTGVKTDIERKLNNANVLKKR